MIERFGVSGRYVQTTMFKDLARAIDYCESILGITISPSSFSELGEDEEEVIWTDVGQEGDNPTTITRYVM